MQTTQRRLVLLMAMLLLVPTSLALSREIGRDIEFPAGYDRAKQKAILSVIRDERFKFVSGLVSYWPPDWGTRLSFAGDTESLNAFIKSLRQIRGIGLRMLLYKGRNDELRRDSAWQLDFSKAHPDLLTIYVNLNSGELDMEKLQLPEWQPASD